MSQYPYQDPNQYPQSLPYAVPATRSGQSLPGALRVMAVLGIAFGSLGLLGSAYGILNSVLTLSNGGRNPMLGTAAPMDPIVSRITMGESVIGLLFAGVMLGACAAALKLRPAARVIMIVWSILSIFRTVIATAVSINWVLPATSAALRGMGGAQGKAASNMFDMIGMASVIGGALLSLVLPILYLTLWNRRDVKAAFAGQDPN